MIKYIILFAILALLIAAFYHGIIIRRYEFATLKLPADKDIRIVHVTDLHNALYGKNQKNLLKKIEKLEPDIILMTGDFFDTTDYYDNSAYFMKQAVNIAPCYFVTGNHEYWTYDIVDIERFVLDMRVNIIDNNSIVLDVDGAEIEIFGIDDPDAVNYTDFYEYESWNEMLEGTYSHKKTDSYSILLSHRPERVEDYKKYDYDLILTGHSHGGQVRIPFLVNGLYVPNQGWFPEYAGGMYQYNNTTQIVNRGLCKNIRLPRVFNPPEIVFIELKGEAIS